MRRWGTALRFGLLLGGAVLLGLLIIQIGPAAILASFTQLSWRLLIILLFPFSLVTVFDVLGWHFAFGRARVPFAALYSARVAGEAFNVTTPTASVGGEAVKAWLVRRHVAYSEGVASVIVAKTTITIAQGLFLLLGVMLAGATLLPDSRLLHAMKWLLVIEVLAVGGFVLVQVVGVFGGGARLLKHLGLADVGARTESLQKLDHGLRHFYRRRPGRLVLSIACHFMGWVLSGLETYVIIRLLGVPLPLLTVLVIEAFSTGIRFATFFVPGSLGALEGGHVMTFVALGLGAPLGLAFSLVRRVREAAWTAAGLVIFAAMRPGLGPAPAEV
ncbi:MAG: hypothetical protein AUH29_06375 [Candidatus Rokubacteria bacterium 13_1_40CM_69_27]|nr:MAG: hypothetical protein AUH29_06375 [Candidatus Rokubacteria bacterium 13_1_40CM_69_27]